MSATTNNLAARVLSEVATQDTKVGVAKILILGGYGNVEVLYALLTKFSIGEDQYRYPEIFRAKLVEHSELTREQARATRGPSIPRQPDEVAALYEKLRAPDVDLAALISSMPESRAPVRKQPRPTYVHRRSPDDAAMCGDGSERLADTLGEVTCPTCLAGYEGWINPDGSCPECHRHETEGHTEQCGLVTGESPLAELTPYAKGAPGVGATRKPYLLARRAALHEKQVRDEEKRLARMTADVEAQKTKLASLTQAEV